MNNEIESSEEDQFLDGEHKINVDSAAFSEQLNKKPDTKKSLRSSKKISSVSSPRPKSSKSNLTALKTREGIEALSRATSQRVIKSVYSLISSKFPMAFGKGELSQKDQEEIQEFFLKKKYEFNKALEEISQTNAITPKKKRKMLKNNDLHEQRYLNELLFMQEKQQKLKKELIRRASEKILKDKNKLRRQQEIEAKRKEREEKKLQEIEKNLIIQNIENFYKDRIIIIKDHLQKEAEAKRILEYDQKLYISAIAKEQRLQRIQSISELRYKYDMRIEELKDKLNII